MENLRRNLNPGGKLVCEFGGSGCAETVHSSLECEDGLKNWIKMFCKKTKILAISLLSSSSKNNVYNFFAQ